MATGKEACLVSVVLAKPLAAKRSPWTYPDLTDTLGLDLHFAAEVNSAVAGMAALALLCISFSKLMGDFWFCRNNQLA